MKIDESTAGRLEASVQRARLLLGSGRANRLEGAEAAGGVRAGPPDEQDVADIAAKIRAVRAERRDGAERTECAGRADQAERADRALGPDRGDRAERAECAGRADQAERADRALGADRGDRAELAEGAERADLAQRDDHSPLIAGESSADEAEALAADIVRRARELLAAIEGGAGEGAVSDADAVAFEAVLQVRGRPALKVEQRLEPIDDEKHPGSGFWRPFISDPQEQQLLEVASAAGAVVAKDRSGKPAWVQGTAWLIGADLVVTNRHVLFPPVNGTALAKRTAGAPLTAQIRPDCEVTIDFAHDSAPAKNMVYTIKDIPFVSRGDDPIDVAVIRVAPTPSLAGQAPHPLVLSSGSLSNDYVYVVGHPGVVLNVPADVMAVFGSPDERKRVSLGKVMKNGVPRKGEVLHDASTIGGYSGGCVLTFGSPKVVALHYYGHPLAGNRAFMADTLRSHEVAGFF